MGVPLSDSVSIQYFNYIKNISCLEKFGMVVFPNVVAFSRVLNFYLFNRLVTITTALIHAAFQY